MMRAMYSGVSGLRNHQTRMDVIGNNISNVNTVGFKTGRVNFKDVFNQTLQGASAAQGNQGGINPMQVGMGMGLATIDTIFSRGTYQSTGRITDLSIEGQGFFVLQDTNGNPIYTRAGNFDFDTEGNLTVAGAGYKVVGYLSDGNGNITSNQGPIRVPQDTMMKGQATSTIKMGNTLSATAPIGASTQASTVIYDAEGRAHTVLVDYIKSGDNTWIYKLNDNNASVVPETQMGELTFNSDGTVGSVKTLTPPTPIPNAATFNGFQMDSRPGSVQQGYFTVYDSASVPHVMQMTFTNSGPNTWGYQIFDQSVNGAIPLSSGTVGYDSATRHYTVGGVDVNVPAIPPATNHLSFAYSGGTANILLDGINTFPPDANGFLLGSQSQIATTTSVDIAALKLDTNTNSMHDKAITVFDSKMNPHVFKMTVTRNTAGTWDYRLTEPGVSPTNVIVSGTIADTGTAYAGLPPSFTYRANGVDETVNFNVLAGSYNASGPGGFSMTSAPTFGVSASQAQVQYLPRNGGTSVPLNLDMMSLNHLGGESTVKVALQNGYGQGKIEEITIDNTGTIIGKFTNGQLQSIAQVSLAMFNNPGGLTKVGETMYSVSNNSGTADVAKVGEGGRGIIKPSALEMSNVDMAEEMSNMIITQRGFQSNSKIITTSDEMLQELVNLKR